VHVADARLGGEWSATNRREGGACRSSGAVGRKGSGKSSGSYLGSSPTSRPCGADHGALDPEEVGALERTVTPIDAAAMKRGLARLSCAGYWVSVRHKAPWGRRTLRSPLGTQGCERQIRVAIDTRYNSQQFLKGNWRWLIATLAGSAGAVTAWLKLVRGGE
jgi:hypothetical protein